MSEKSSIILIVLLTISVMFNLYQLFRPDTIQEKEVIVEKHDTVINYIKDYDTVYYEKIRYKDHFVYDTIHKNEIVYIRDTSVVNRDSTSDYTIDISAVKLDWYKLNIHARDTVTVTNTIEKYIKKKRWKPQIGVYGGLGYDFASKKVGPQVGIGVTLPLTSW